MALSTPRARPLVSARVPKRLLLIGAGFSRNWGGWLASEVHDHLIGSRAVRENPAVRTALMETQKSGGFEAALL